jgi:hypothetical protein
MGRHTIVLSLVVAAACSRGSDSGNSPFNSTWGSSAMPTSEGPTEDEDDGDESSGGSSGSSGGDPSGDASSGGGSTSGTPDATTGGGAETAMDVSSGGAMMPGNGQPAMGMYADCFEPDLDNCTADASVCLMVETFMTGFCTHDECTGPDGRRHGPVRARLLRREDVSRRHDMRGERVVRRGLPAVRFLRVSLTRRSKPRGHRSRCCRCLCSCT